MNQPIKLLKMLYFCFNLFQERIERLIQSIILEQNKLDVNETLPNVLLDKTSLNIAQSFSCANGQVVVGNDCGKLLDLFTTIN
jgi:hypothetical protein